MNREECENQILEKLKEIKDIAKQYDISSEFYLSLCIMDEHLSVNNCFYENTKTPINASLLHGKIRHWRV